MNLLRSKFEEYENLTNEPDIEIIKLFLISILHTYSISSTIFRTPIIEYFIYVKNKYDIDVNELSVPENLNEALREICFKRKIPLQQLKIKDQVSIDSYLTEYGGITFDNLCKYISDSKFRYKGQDIAKPIFEYYDELSETKKEEFMKDYLEFNKMKQLNVENYQNSRLSVEPNLYSMKSKNQNLVRYWIDESSRYIENKLTADPINDEDRILHYFASYFETFHLKSILNLIINELLTSNGIKFTILRNKLTYSLPKNKMSSYITPESFAKLIWSLTNIIISNSKIDAFDAFSKEVKHENNKDHLIINLNPILSDLIIDNNSNGNHLPMVCPPKKWTTPTNGGYLSGSPLISSFDSLQKQIYSKLAISGDLDNAYNFIDNIGKIPWVIDQEMLYVFNELIKLPNGFLEIPPIKNESFELSQYRSQVEIVNKMANAFGKNGDILFHCYVFDFRGRVYTKSCLSHYGSDLTRSLFKFWKSEKLGNDGFYWIKYQLRSAFGSTIDVRQFYNENIENILNSAGDPMNFKWWIKGDDPFSTLSVCFEIRKILNWVNEGNRIEEFKSRLPIHQDGSCNGLQHYAALARDCAGGKAVNLTPSETKQDVYIEVQQLVKKKLEANFENNELAKFFHSILSRKLVKRPVMTTVYGVTLRGAAIHIFDEIKEIVQNHENSNKEDYNQETISRMKKITLSQTSYLAMIILSSIEELFFNAKQIEHWLVMNVNRMLTSFNLKTFQYLTDKDEDISTILDSPKSYSPIIWTTPIQFPVVQIYRNIPKRSYTGHYFDYTHKLYPMDKRKNMNGVAPNFIHSLDAAHLSLTCNEVGKMTFSAIHDCYWTHANKVEEMSRVLREKFVELHSIDILEQTKLEFENQMKDNYQFVYFSKFEYPELYRRIKMIRKRYPEKGKVQSMIYELNEIVNLGPDHDINKLLQEFQPKLYHKVNSSKYYEYNDRGESIESVKGRTGVWMPVQIIDVPPKGQLDINQVLRSKYFFS
ncbi:unnamed protein product [Candida verbasci]|uniref:DNA-directed RNA polymerase n=1 Tax=Candida verbasci TaxID=1227364 RepID=A0A9W4XC53_9ASCO|nr:unnamed protein product [Candida verbasci]